MESREELLRQIEKTAHDYERDYHGCARSVYRALQEHLHLGDGSVFMAATPLAGGIAMRGETCGALLGGLLAVGLVTASTDMKDEVTSLNAMVAGFRLYHRFEKAMAGSRCRELQTARFGRFYNLADPADFEMFGQAGGYMVCSDIAGKAARLAAEFILELWEEGKAARLRV
ncbi:MAG: C-GCAxxG-C-C family protein [Chloroflexi bacterium]|nr:C-GCAxxG-C-C family protein [Chloroflexota bacterium]